MAGAKLSLEDIPPDKRRGLGITLPRQHTFRKEGVRSWALKVLALMAGLTQDQRRRVLEHAAKVNRL